MSHTRMARIALAGFALSLLVGGVRPAAAQIQVEISPFTGLFAPLSDMWEEVAPFGDNVFQLEHAPALSFGARLAVWLGDHYGLEAAIAHAQSRVQAHEVASPSVFLQSEQSVGAQVTAYTLRVAWRSAPARAVGFHVTGGLGALTRGGDAYSRLEGTTDLAAVVGAGMRLRMSDLVVLRLDLENYVSNAQFQRQMVTVDLGGSQGNVTGRETQVEIVDLDGGVQHDLVFSQSIVITIGGR